MKPYEIGNWGPSDPDALTSLAVNETVFFAIPITFGTPFDLGIYGLVQAGERAFGNVGGNDATSDRVPEPGMLAVFGIG